MSHSKFTKRGKSLFIESWNPATKKHINTCVLCGTQGYNPSIDDEGFIGEEGKAKNFEHRAMRDELRKVMKPLALDELGRCETCAKVMDKG